MSFSFLVVDDERLSRDYIQDLISEYVPSATLFEASSVAMALPVLESSKPDFLFLDISMPGADGFSLLEETTFRDFELVFITAYGEHAIRAFKAGASDYILKPIKKTDFKDTLEKVIKRRTNEIERRKYSSGADLYLTNKLVINQQVGLQAVTLKDILYLKADNSYTTIFTAGNDKIVSSKPIHHFEETLSNEWFFRIHKSHIINFFHFKEYNSVSKSVLMKNGEKLIISRYRLAEFLKKIRYNLEKL